MASIDRQAVEILGRKGGELALRQVGLAPEQRSARRLHAARQQVDIDPSGARVLMLSPRDWAYHTMVDGAVATGLSARGAEVKFLSCGGGLGVCDRSNVVEAPPMPCTTCSRYVAGSIAAFGFDELQMAEGWTDAAWPELDTMSIESLREVSYRGVPVGELMAVPSRWFLLASRADMDPLHPMMFREFLRTARRVVDGLLHAFEAFEPDHVMMLSGLFSFESVALWLCRDRGIGAVTYERTYRPDTLIFKRDAPASHYDITPAWERHRDESLTSEQHAELDSYVEGRRDSSHPIYDFWDGAEDRGPERRRSGKLVALFTNVTWDSAVIGRERAFDSIHAWIDASIATMAARPDDELVIRIHPAETKMTGKKTREPILDYLHKYHPDLPPNVAVVGPDEKLSSYPLMEAADIGLVLTSIVGLELALLGKPVLVAGKPHYSERGFTFDSYDEADYERQLIELLDAPPPMGDRLELARRYAYAFFFRVPVPFPFVAEPLPGLARLTTYDFADYVEGANEYLDRVCDGILHGGDFLRPRADAAAVAR